MLDQCSRYPFQASFTSQCIHSNLTTTEHSCPSSPEIWLHPKYDCPGVQKAVPLPLGVINSVVLLMLLGSLWDQNEAGVLLRTHHCLASFPVQADFPHSLSPVNTPSVSHASKFLSHVLLSRNLIQDTSSNDPM